MNQDSQAKPGKSLGQAMLFVSCMLALLALTGFFSGVLDRQANPNRQPESILQADGLREVRLERNRQGHYLSGGSINGLQVQFLLDTGATNVAIPLSVARAAKLVVGAQGRAFTANGATEVYDTHIEELSLGNITLRDVDASIIPNMNGETILLGMSALREIEFFQRGSTMTLRQLPPGAGS